MPVYEFYCPACHVIFNFHSWRVNTEKQPSCPRCAKPNLERKVSRFAISKNRPEPSAPDPLGNVDEEKLESAMMSMAGELESIDESNPRALGRFMRQLYGAAGLNPGGSFEEAMRRLEAGEDPDAIEDDLGDRLDEDDPLGGGKELFEPGGLARIRKRLRPPEKDETLHSL